MAEEEYETNTATLNGVGGGDGVGDDYKSEVSQTDLIKLELLKGLISKNVNLSDFELSELTGFPSTKIRNIRMQQIKSKSDLIDTPLSYDYVLAFNVGSNEDKFRHKPTKRDLKNKPEDDNDAEWQEGMPQDKYYGQIFNNFWQRLEAAKLSVRAFRSQDNKTMFLVVGITESNLKFWADERDTDLLIDPVGGVEVGRQKNFALARRTKLNSSGDGGGGDLFTETLDISNWYYLYGEYAQQANPKVYKHYKRLANNDKLETVFDERTRLRIIYESIIADSNEGGAEIKIEDCLLHKSHPLIAVFPLHDSGRLEFFDSAWIKNCNPLKWMWCPLQEIRDYFGEPVAFYFAFLQFYLHWLIAPGFVGTLFFIWQIANGEIAVDGIPFLCFFMIFWSVAFVDFWSRAEARYRLQWGMTKFQQKAVARPQFNGEWTHDVVTGLWVEEFSVFKRAFRVGAIYMFVVIWLGGCVVAVVQILLLRDADPNNLPLKIGLGVANGVMIFVFDAIYKLVSKYGNEWENHRTEQDFQNALIIKSFCFKFINSFASLFYLGFIRPATNGLYYYVHFYTAVCEAAPHYMSQFLTTYDTTYAPYDWYTTNVKTSDENYAPCIAGNDDQACIELVLDDKRSNEAWEIVTDGYYYRTGKTCPNGLDSSDSTRCAAVCDKTDTLIEQNEAVLGELQIQLLTLFLTAIIIQNTLEVGLPFLGAAIKGGKKR